MDESTEQGQRHRVRIGGEVLSLRIAVAGNPNSGKTTVFNLLTGARQHVGNYAGVTVDKVEGLIRHDGREIHVLDLPGTYSLSEYSPEERVATEALLDGTLQAVLYVADAGLLERSLLLAIQIREMGLPMVICCNMMDEVRKGGQDIDFTRLSQALGAKAVPTVGVRNEGIDDAFHAVERAALAGAGPALTVPYGPVVDPLLDDMVTVLTEEYPEILKNYGSVSPRWMALKLLEQDPLAWEAVQTADEEAGMKLHALTTLVTDRLAEKDETIEDVISEQRYRFSRSVVAQCLTSTELQNRLRFTDRLDRILAHNVFGILAMVAILWAMFALVIDVGAWPQEILENAFTFCSDLIKGYLPESLFRSLLTDGIIAGVGSVLSFVPLIVILFICIAFLEDSGYVARMAYISDRVFHWFGLQGVSVMPYIIAGGIPGGCAIPGVMATRTMRSPREKMATMLTVPYMTCGAKVPVLTLLCACFFEKNASLVFVLFVFFGWTMALIMSLIFRHTLLRGASTPLVMEMPPYRRPTVRTVLLRAWERTWMYMRKAVVILIPVAIVLWAAMEFPSLPPEKAAPYENAIAQLEARQLSLAKEAVQLLEVTEARLSSMDSVPGLARTQAELLLVVHAMADDARAMVRNAGRLPDENDAEKDPDRASGNGSEEEGEGEADLGGRLENISTALQRLRTEAGNAQDAAFQTREEVLQKELTVLREIQDSRDATASALEDRKNEQEFAQLEYSVAGKIGRAIETFTEPIGFNWRTDIALLGGIAAKEAIVSTLGTAYSLGRDRDEEDNTLREQLRAQKDWNPAVAMSLLIFVMLYSPCFVTLGVMKSEAGGWKWVLFSIVFNTALAYLLSYVVYTTYPYWGELLS